MDKIITKAKEIVADIINALNESGEMVAEYNAFEAQCNL